MARKRMIAPGIWQNEQVGTLPPEGRLLFIGMFSNADDEGRLKGSAAYLKAIVFPYDENLTVKRVEELKQQVASHGLVVLYRSAGQEYLWLPTWDRYQKIKTPSASPLPPPPAGDPSASTPSAGADAVAPQDFPSDGEGLPKCFGNVSEPFPPRLEEVRGSKERLGECRSVEGKGSGGTVPGPVPPADGLQPPASSSSSPDSQGLVLEASPGERQCLKLLRGLPHWPFDFQRDLAYLRQLSVEFPTVDMPREVSDFATHVMDKPINKNRGSPRLRLRHWIEKGAQFAKERRQQGDRGQRTGQGLSQPGRAPEKAARQPIQPIESGPDEEVGPGGRRLIQPVAPDDTS